MADYTQAMMDLGATLALDQNPIACIVHLPKDAKQNKMNQQDQFPTRKQLEPNPTIFESLNF